MQTETENKIENAKGLIADRCGVCKKKKSCQTKLVKCHYVFELQQSINASESALKDGETKERERIVKSLKNLARNNANPCMKCGSVQCAICYKDLEELLAKMRGD